MKVIFVEIKKDEYIFNLKLEKEEIAYLFKLAIAEYKYYLETYIFHSKNNDNEKGHFLGNWLKNRVDKIILNKKGGWYGIIKIYYTEYSNDGMTYF